MAEFWDIYDQNKCKTGKLAQRDVYQFKRGEYHLVVVAVIMNSKNEILITKRAKTKKKEPGQNRKSFSRCLYIFISYFQGLIYPQPKR